MSECRFETRGEPCDCGKGQVHQGIDLGEGRTVMVRGKPPLAAVLGQLAGLAATGKPLGADPGVPGGLAELVAKVAAAGQPLPPFHPTRQRTWKPKPRKDKLKARQKAKTAAASRAKNRGRR